MQIEKDLNSKQVKALISALTSLSSEKETSAFVRDIFTYSEIRDAARRLQAAKLLDKKVTVRRIASATHMSSATISRINYWLHHGTGGYRAALKGLT